MMDVSRTDESRSSEEGKTRRKKKSNTRQKPKMSSVDTNPSISLGNEQAVDCPPSPPAISPDPPNTAADMTEHASTLPSVEVSTVSPLQESSSKRKKKRKKRGVDSSAVRDDRPTLNDPSPQSVGATSACVSGGHLNTSVSSFERELEWCIAQLEIGLSRSGASKTQKQENERFIRSLRSEKTPLPRKRQLMKNLFGDYRTRMMQEPLPKHYKPPLPPSISVVADKSTLDSTGQFFKKSALRRHKESANVESAMGGVSGALIMKDECSLEGGGKSDRSELPKMFHFNFNVES